MQTRSEKFDWSALTTDELTKTLDIFANDGHTIYTLQYLDKQQCPESVITHFVQEYESDLTDPKQTIKVNGQPVYGMKGVYGLTVLWSMANHFHITSDKMGRGFQASDLTTKLRYKIPLLSKRFVK